MGANKYMKTCVHLFHIYFHICVKNNTQINSLLNKDDIFHKFEADKTRQSNTWSNSTVIFERQKNLGICTQELYGSAQKALGAYPLLINDFKF